MKNNTPKWIIKRVKANEDYTLDLLFESGEKKRFDMAPVIKKYKVFSSLKNINLFKKVKTQFPSIEWPGELDIDPKTLYDKSTPISPNIAK